jgi:hypothetical protein
MIVSQFPLVIYSSYNLRFPFACFIAQHYSSATRSISLHSRKEKLGFFFKYAFFCFCAFEIVRRSEIA